MNRWLAEESKWAREKALEATREAENLTNAEWCARRVVKIAAEEVALFKAIDQWLRLRSERDMLEDSEQRAEKVARLRRDAEYWQRLADEQSARLAQSESESLFAGEGA